MLVFFQNLLLKKKVGGRLPFFDISINLDSFYFKYFYIPKNIKKKKLGMDFIWMLKHYMGILPTAIFLIS